MHRVERPNAEAERPASGRTVRSLELDRPFGRQILNSHAVPTPETLARLCYAPHELWMVLQLIASASRLVIRPEIEGVTVFSPAASF